MQYLIAEKQVWTQQADAVISVAPAANTLYPILAATPNVQVKSVSASVTWTVQPDPLEIVIVVDGITWTYSFANPVSTTNYILAESVVSLAADQASQILAATLSATTTFHRVFEGRNVAIYARTGKTTAGTVSNLTARVKYARIP